MEKKKLQFPLISLILICMFASTSHAGILFKETPHLNFTVWPEPVPYAGGSDWQYLEFCSRAAVNRTLFLSFIFDEPLASSRVELDGAYEGYIEESYKENITKSKLDQITSSNPMDSVPRCDIGVPHPLNQKLINYTLASNGTIGYACLNSTENLGGGVFNVSWYQEVTKGKYTLVNKSGFHNIKDRFEHYEFTGNYDGTDYVDADAYVANKTFEPDECVLFRIKYTVSIDEPDAKYDLAGWASPTNDFLCWKTDTCYFEGLLDPTFVNVWDYFINHTATSENDNQYLETSVFNFNIDDVNASCFVPGLDRWVYTDVNNATNQTNLDFYYTFANGTNFSVWVNTTRPDTPIINGSLIQQYFCNNTAVSNNSNGNNTFFEFRDWPPGSTFPGPGWQLNFGNVTANPTGGLIIGPSAGSPSFGTDTLRFNQNTTVISSYKATNDSGGTCYGFHENTNCAGVTFTMYFVIGNLAGGASGRAEGNNYGTVFTAPSALNNAFYSLMVRRNGSNSTIWGHDVSLFELIRTATSTNLRNWLYNHDTGVNPDNEGFIPFIAFANQSADITWNASAIQASASVVTTIVSPTTGQVFNSSAVLFNMTAVGTFASYTCNYTRNGVTSSNWSLVDSTYYSENWNLGTDNYTLSSTCSNSSTTNTDNISFIVNVSGYSIVLNDPAPSELFFNKSINFNYSINFSNGSSTAVELYVDDALAYNDTITTNTTFIRNVNTTYYGTHTWYVFVYQIINQSINETSSVQSFDVDFNSTPVLLSPPNATTTQNKTLALSYSVNLSAEENTTVQVIFDDVLIFNDTIDSFTNFSKLYNSSYGDHSWYVFSFLTENQSFNDTSEIWNVSIDFEVNAINPADGLNLSAINVVFSYNVSTLSALNCSIVIDGDYVDNRTLNFTQTVSTSISLDEGVYNYLISCTDFIDITYQKNTTNRTFEVSFTALTSILNLTDYPQNVYTSPQTIFFDTSGDLYVYYFSNNNSIEYVNLIRLNSNLVVEEHFRQALNRTLDFFVSMQESDQIVLMTFNNDSTILHLFNISETELTISNLSTTYNDTMSNDIADPFTYAYYKQYETLDIINGSSYYLFVLPLTNGSVLIKKFAGNESLEQVASANGSLRVVWQTITNRSNLTNWRYAFPKNCTNGNYSIAIYNYDGSSSSELSVPDGNCYNQPDIENSTVYFESYGNKTYALIANISNFTTIYLIEEDKILNFTHTVMNPSNFFFVDKYTFVFFSEEPSDTIAYSCYFEDVANCTRLTSSEYGVVVPYDRGHLVTSKREALTDVVIKGAISSGSNTTQLTYNFNRYDVKMLCYDEIEEYRKVFTVRILTNTTSTVLKNNSWGYVLPSAIFGIGSRFAYTTCTNGTQRLYFIGLTGNFTQFAFSLDSTAGQFYTFTVVNEYGLPIPNALISLYRFSDLFNSQMVVEQGITDFGGHVTLFMKTFDPYLITLSATSYIPATFPFTPSTITSVEIQLTPNTTSQLIMPDYQIVFQDVLWSLTFNASPASQATFFTNPYNGTFQVLSNSSAIEYFGMAVYYNGTTVVFFQNITSQPIGGFIQYEATLPGKYRYEVWFKREGFDEYRPYVRTINLGNNTGLAGVGTILQEDQPISGWGYYFIVSVIAMLAGGFAARYTLEGAGLIFLTVLWVGTLMFPGAIVACMFGSTCLTAFSATALTTVAVGAGFFIKQYV